MLEKSNHHITPIVAVLKKSKIKNLVQEISKKKKKKNCGCGFLRPKQTEKLFVETNFILYVLPTIICKN